MWVNAITPNRREKKALGLLYVFANGVRVRRWYKILFFVVPLACLAGMAFADPTVSINDVLDEECGRVRCVLQLQAAATMMPRPTAMSMVAFTHGPMLGSFFVSKLFAV